MRIVRISLLLACLAGIVVALNSPWTAELRQGAAARLERLGDLGVWGLVLIAAIYTPASLLLVPGSLLTLVAGYFYPLGPALIAMSLGSTLAAGIVFLVGRTLARGWVERRLAIMPRFRALDRAVGDNGFKIVFLTRLSPLFPFTLLNYAYSLTRVSFRDYVLASWIGMMPGTVLYVYLGSLVGSFSDLLNRRLDEEGPTYWLRQGFFALGLVATLAATIIIGRIAHKALTRALDAVEEPPHG